MMSYFHQLTAILFCFSFYPSYSVGDPVDIISFKIQREGTRNFGSLRVPSLNIKSDFSIHELNKTHKRILIIADDPYRFVTGGNVAVVEKDGVTSLKGQLETFPSQAQVKFNSNFSLVDGHKLESKIDFDVPDIINGTYLFKFSARNDTDGCFPINFAHNLTTSPPGLINYNSGIKSICKNGNTHVDLDLSVKSDEWSWLNTDLKQFWFYNSTGGYESMNCTHPSYDIDVIANWTSAPEVKKFKMANFRSKKNNLPSFRIKYLVDGDEKKMLYEKI